MKTLFSIFSLVALIGLLFAIVPEQPKVTQYQSVEVIPLGYSVEGIQTDMAVLTVAAFLLSLIVASAISCFRYRDDNDFEDIQEPKNGVVTSHSKRFEVGWRNSLAA